MPRVRLLQVKTDNMTGLWKGGNRSNLNRHINKEKELFKILVRKKDGKELTGDDKFKRKMSLVLLFKLTKIHFVIKIANIKF